MARSRRKYICSENNRNSDKTGSVLNNTGVTDQGKIMLTYIDIHIK